MGEEMTAFREKMKELIKKGVEEAFEKAMDAMSQSLADWVRESQIAAEKKMGWNYAGPSKLAAENDEGGREIEVGGEGTQAREMPKLLPEMPALQVFDENSERIFVQKAPTSISQETIGPEQITEVVSWWTGIPSKETSSNLSDAEKMYNTLKAPRMSKHCGSNIVRCGLCGVTEKSVRNPSEKSTVPEEKRDFADDFNKLECSAALVFFRTRYAALVAAQTLEHTNPMLWVTEMAPEPEDVLWANICVPYRLLWVRKLGILIAFIAFLIFFLLPVSFIQGLVHLEKLEKKFSYLRKLRGKRNFISDMVTGYLPSAMLTLFLLFVPPIMIVSSAVEGPVARSLRKRSACIKVLYFVVWNVFFANILSGSVFERFDKITSLKDIPVQLANGVPSMAVFFMTYILTSGWTSLAFELVQPYPLLLHWLDKGLFRGKNVLSCESLTFPYHTELPRALLFVLLGFTSAVTAPLMLPFLLIYFFMAYLIYRNQFINVYVTKYDTGGLYWPIAHSAIIFSLMLMQLILLGVFGLKKSAVASGFTIPLIVSTFLFHLYCRQRFLPVFKRKFPQVIMDMDKQDELSGKLEEYHDQLLSGAYCQFKTISKSSSTSGNKEDCENRKLDFALVAQVKQPDSNDHDRLQDPKDSKPAVKKSNQSPNRFRYERTNEEIEESKADAL